MIGRTRDARAAIRILAVALPASTLAGCYPATAPYTARRTRRYPNDYRKRHPIALREGNRVVEVFIGSNRGALTPAQRADVLSFAQVWKGESTGGILIDVPNGTKNELRLVGGGARNPLDHRRHRNSRQHGRGAALSAGRPGQACGACA